MNGASVARYFYNLRSGHGVCPDENGVDQPSKEQAIQYSRKLAAELPAQGPYRPGRWEALSRYRRQASVT